MARSLEIDWISYDAVVVGAGSAGCRAAIAAAEAGARTLLLVKGDFGHSGSTFFPHNYGFGMQAHTEAAEEGDSIERHYHDIIAVSRGLCNPRLARILAEEAAARLRDLEAYGMEMDRVGPSGGYLQVRGCYASKDRCFQITGLDQYRRAFGEELRRLGVAILERTMALELVSDDEGACAGLLIVERGGQAHLVTSGAVILATGGACAVYQHSFTTPEVTGDGYALGLRAGALLRNMEFQQIGWGLLAPVYGIPFLDRVLRYEPKMTLGDGRPAHAGRYPEARWVEAMRQRAFHFPFSSEDDSRIVDQTIVEARKVGEAGPHGGFLIDLASVPQEEIARAPLWPIWYTWLVSTGFDPRSTPIEVTVFAHAFNGGLWIGENGETTVPGLYAAGETAAGPHGADRLGGNMQTACQVFGARAGKAAAARARRRPPQQSITARALAQILDRAPFAGIGTSPLRGMDELEARIAEIKRLMWENVLVCREEKGLSGTRAAILDCAQHVPNWRELLAKGRTDLIWKVANAENLLTSAYATTLAALTREESRGAHYRIDFPTHAETTYFVDVTMEEGQIITKWVPVENSPGK